jgi:YVTN family beta-propeller protein
MRFSAATLVLLFFLFASLMFTAFTVSSYASNLACASPNSVSGSAIQLGTPASPTSSLKRITVGDAPLFDAYDPVHDLVYVSNSGEFNIASLSIIRGARVIATIGSAAICGNAHLQGVAFNPINKLVYVADTFNNKILVMNGTTLLTTISVKCPLFLAYDPVNRFVLASNNCELANDNTITLISGLKVVHVVQMSVTRYSSPGGIAVVNNRIFVANTIDNSLSVLSDSSFKMIGSIKLGVDPFEMAFDPVNKQLYITNTGDNTVSVIDVQSLKVAHTIHVGQNPYGILFSPKNHNLYVANNGGSTVSIINGFSVINTIQAGTTPAGLAYDSVNQLIYVTNSAENGYVSLLT